MLVLRYPGDIQKLMDIQGLLREILAVLYIAVGSEIVVKVTDINYGMPKKEKDLKVEEFINIIKS